MVVGTGGAPGIKRREPGTLLRPHSAWDAPGERPCPVSLLQGEPRLPQGLGGQAQVSGRWRWGRPEAGPLQMGDGKWARGTREGGSGGACRRTWLRSGTAVLEGTCAPVRACAQMRVATEALSVDSRPSVTCVTCGHGLAPSPARSPPHTRLTFASDLRALRPCPSTPGREQGGRRAVPRLCCQSWPLPCAPDPEPGGLRCCTRACPWPPFSPRGMSPSGQVAPPVAQRGRGHSCVEDS